MAVQTPQVHDHDVETSHEYMYRVLRERICLGELPPGDVLSEKVLADEFGVSRTPLRRALQRLEYDDLVVTKHGIGTIVAPIDIRTIKELYALRMELAELIGQLPPVAVIHQEEIDEFKKIQARLEEMSNQPDAREIGLLNFHMHEVQLRLIGNSALRKVFDQLYYRSIRLWMQLLPDMNLAEEIHSLKIEVVQTLEAMRAQDVCTVGLIRRNSMSLSLGRIKQYLGGASEVNISREEVDRRNLV
jgi:DNA-binding GntR family transcriptional regulator